MDARQSEPTAGDPPPVSLDFHRSRTVDQTFVDELLLTRPSLRVTRERSPRLASRKNHFLDAGLPAGDLSPAFGLVLARYEDDLGFRMPQDVGHAVSRFAEIDGHDDRAQPLNGKVRHVPLRAVRREERHAVAARHSQLCQAIGKSRNAPQHLLRRKRLPFGALLVHLRPGRRVPIDSLQQPSGHVGISLDVMAWHSTAAHRPRQPPEKPPTEGLPAASSPRLDRSKNCSVSFRRDVTVLFNFVQTHCNSFSKLGFRFRGKTKAKGLSTLAR